MADFCYNRDRDQATLIEVSPLRRCTGPCLFSWDFLDSLDGTHIEFRMALEPRQGVDNLLESWIEATFGSPCPEVPYFVAARASSLGLLWKGITAATASLLLPALESRTTLFFYGTLRRGYHWSAKYLPLEGGASFLGNATTRGAKILLGECGVPYFLSDDSDKSIVQGELWSVNDEILRGLDDYEGTTKGHYVRVLVDAYLENQEEQEGTKAFVYIPSESMRKTLEQRLAQEQAVSIQEYSLEIHHRCYNPIAHIQLKQSLYLCEGAESSN